MWGKGEINDPKKMIQYEREMPEKTIKNLKDAYASYMYHMDPDVTRILAAQRRRISNAFDLVERAMDGVHYKKILPYKPIGLQKEWDAWSHDRVLAARSKLDAYIDQWLPGLVEGHANKDERELAKKDALAGDDAKQTRIDKIDALAAALKARPAWNSFPF
jgi:hypothetical protein